MTTTVAARRQRIIEDNGLGFASTTTADGNAGATTLEDNVLADYVDSELVNKWVMPTSFLLTLDVGPHLLILPQVLH